MQYNIRYHEDTGRQARDFSCLYLVRHPHLRCALSRMSLWFSFVGFLICLFHRGGDKEDTTLCIPFEMVNFLMVSFLDVVI